MKYFNIKRYKFSTILKNFNALFIKNIKTLGSNVFKIFNFINPRQYNLKRVYKYLDVRDFNFIKVTKYLNPRTYNFSSLGKIKFTSSKFWALHLPLSIAFFGFLYLVIPTFYNYDKSNLETLLCKKQGIKCSIVGKVKYRFYPTPRLKINNLIINGLSQKEKKLIIAEKVAIKLSIKNLLAKEKHKFRKIEISDFDINLNVENFKKYKNLSLKKISLVPITFTKGKIVIFDKKDYVATIDQANLNLEFIKNSISTILKGKFLNDDIYINLDVKKNDNKILTNIILKLSKINFLTKANFLNLENEENIKGGNFLVKQGRNRITAIFDFIDNEFIIKESNIRNAFLDGELIGKITILPYFGFNLDLNLNSINFTKLYNSFLALDENNQKSLFKINNKINGKLNLSSDKIYSSYNLVKSLESRLKFYNGNISIEQLLLNLGKLGAADILGTINNDPKFTNFKFESNIFVDNQKKFLSKFGIYNKENIPSNLFVSGSFDLRNIKTSFYEISNDKKLSSEDINYIEKEFNDLMSEKGYKNLFHFPHFKKFIKSITSEIN